MVQRAGTGQPLDVTTRSFMESRFGADFGGVRVHADEHAAETSHQLAAHAYTIGSDVFFGRSKYQPSTAPGRLLVAHELAHVLQQASGRTGSAGPISEPGDAGEREAERIALQVVARESGGPVSGPKRVIRRPARAMIQRMTINHCTPAETTAIQDAVRDAQVGLSLAITGIMSPGSDPGVLNRFNYYFGTNAWMAVAMEMGKILTGIPNATYECEYPGQWWYSHFCEGNRAYVRALPPYLGFGEIHLCQPQFHAAGAVRRASDIVHEGAHRFIPAPGDTYYDASCADTAKTRALSDEDRLYNADCYACLVEVGLSAAPAPPAPAPAPPPGGGP